MPRCGDPGAARRVGTLTVGDPRGVLTVQAGRWHNQRLCTWRPGALIRHLAGKAAQAGITVVLVDERGSSSTCPACHRRVLKPTGRIFRCRSCGFCGHRDLTGAANIARRTPAGGPATSSTLPVAITHRRAGRHLPGADGPGVTRGGATITAPPHGPLASRGPPPCGELLATRGSGSLAHQGKHCLTRH